MSVDQKDVIDFVSRSRASGDVILIISDHLDWDQPREHLYILQEKINHYLAYIESGRIFEDCAEADDRRIVIQVMFRCAPPAGEVQQFLDRARVKVAAAGYHFTYGVPVIDPNLSPDDPT